MSKVKKVLLFIGLFFFAMLNAYAESTQSNMIGRGSGKSGSGISCESKAPCQNHHYHAFFVQLVHYDGTKLITKRTTVIYGGTEGLAKKWVTKYVDSKAVHWSELDSDSLYYWGNSKFAENVDKLFTKKVKDLFTKSTFDLKYEDFINELAGGSVYPDHRNIGENGLNTTGYRIIVEPVFLYMDGSNKLHAKTARQIAKSGYLREHWIVDLANCIRFKDDDIGIHGIKSAPNHITEHMSDKDWGYGRGEIGVFDNIYCDPSTDPDHCCKRLESVCKNISGCYPNGALLERYWKDTKYHVRVLKKNMSYSDYKKYCEKDLCNPNTDPDHCCKELKEKCGNNCYSNQVLKERYYKKTSYNARILTSNLPYKDFKYYCPNKCNPDKQADGYCCDIVGDDENNVYDPNVQNQLTRNMSVSEYRNKCKSDSCNYKLLVDIPSDCHSVNKQGKIAEATIGDGYNDNKFGNTWACIFKSKYQSSQIRDQYKVSSSYDNNKYCQIKCRQNFHFNLPGAGTTVERGRYLVINEDEIHRFRIEPLKYDYNKTCRTSDPYGNSGIIDVNQFINDINYNNTLKVDYYTRWKRFEHEIRSCRSARYQYTECTTDDEGNESCDSWYDYGYDSYDGGIDCSYWTSGGWDEGYKTEMEEKYEDLYYKALARENEYLRQINECSNFNGYENTNYKLGFEYEEPVYGDEFNLNERGTTKQSSERYYTSGDSIKNDGGYGQYSMPTEEIRVNDCLGDNHCIPSKYLTYGSAKWVEKQYTQNGKYKLDDYIYRYIDKYSGRSYSGRDKSDEKNDIDMNASNLPIHFSTKKGYYDFIVKFIEINTQSRFHQYLYGSTTFNGKNYNIEDEHYDCEYKVTGDNQNPGTSDHPHDDDNPGDNPGDSNNGLPIIFRPISLKTNNSASETYAFLTRDGNKRTPGSNWNNSTYIRDFIIRNRGTVGSNVYRRPPLYEITLTPNLIREIRAYNKDMNALLISIYDGTNKEKYGIAGYTSTNGLECEESGTKCISTIIRDDWNIDGCVIRKNCPDICNNNNSCS